MEKTSRQSLQLWYICVLELCHVACILEFCELEHVLGYYIFTSFWSSTHNVPICIYNTLSVIVQIIQCSSIDFSRQGYFFNIQQAFYYVIIGSKKWIWYR